MRKRTLNAAVATAANARAARASHRQCRRRVQRRHFAYSAPSAVPQTVLMRWKSRSASSFLSMSLRISSSRSRDVQARDADRAQEYPRYGVRVLVV